eukprot:301701-Chlamydomonas_euryale.AAC.6
MEHTTGGGGRESGRCAQAPISRACLRASGCSPSPAAPRRGHAPCAATARRATAMPAAGLCATVLRTLPQVRLLGVRRRLLVTRLGQAVGQKLVVRRERRMKAADDCVHRVERLLRILGRLPKVLELGIHVGDGAREADGVVTLEALRAGRGRGGGQACLRVPHNKPMALPPSRGPAAGGGQAIDHLAQQLQHFAHSHVPCHPTLPHP